ncbi:MAG: hypothetical protein B7Z80_15020, partial [Rhodospirillales bacterium 20-64-7]
GLGLVECPECGGTDVQRALMAPAVSKGLAPPVSAAPPAQGNPGGSPQDKPQGQLQEQLQAGLPEKVGNGQVPALMLAVLQRIRAEVEKNCDYVGNDFAEEARRMHRGEIEQRPIYGEASDDQAESLADDGIDVSRIPWVPRADG